MRSIRTVRAALRAQSESLIPLLTRHHAITRISVVAVALAIVFAISQQSPSQAGRAPDRPSVASSLLPQNVGVGIATDEAVTLRFPEPMDRASVESALRVNPAQPVVFGWSPDNRTVRVAPATRWMTDQRYVVGVPGIARTQGGAELGAPANVSFTTETAPSIVDFQVRFAPISIKAASLAPDVAAVAAAEADELAVVAAQPADTASRVSSRTGVSFEFSTAMDRAATEAAFVITPAVEGAFAWSGNRMTFEPTTPFTPHSRYAISLGGARDVEGNRIGGDTSFSFTTREGAQLASVRPNIGARDVSGRTLSLRFSQPMNVASVARAFSVTNVTADAAVTGKLSWNRERTHLTFTADADFPQASTISVALTGAADADGNLVERSYAFRTVVPAAAAAATPAEPTRPSGPSAPRPPAPPPPAPSGDAVQYALNQINASRAAYGFRPLVLDGAVTAVANAHAWDMLRYNYFSHTGRDGSTVHTRLSRAGVGYSRAGENICYHSGIGVVPTLNYCHGVFMSEPYPGHFNHIANILNPNYSRVGVGIAASGGRVYVVWDFAG